jgi:hypothetical protein
MNKSKKRTMIRRKKQKKIKSKKRINRKYKNMKGGLNKDYYNPFNRLPINEDLALQIGYFIINSELKRYLLNDNTYYGNNQAYKHIDDDFYRKLKIQAIKSKFENEHDYRWIGNQFYYSIGNQNPFHVIPGVAGYATWDDGVDFFDWITNTPPRSHAGWVIPDEYKNPLNVDYYKPMIKNKSNDTTIIPVGIVKNKIEQYNRQ